MIRPQTSQVSAVEQTLIDIWAQALELNKVGLDDNFFSIGGHSLLALVVIEQIKQRLGWQVLLGEFIGYPTIRELVAQVAKSTAANSDRLIVRLSKRGRLKPIVFVPAIGGMIFSYTKLVRYLSQERACLAFQAPILIGQSAPGSIEELASLYIDSLYSELGNIDVHLVGWSFGGVVAFEMFRTLCEDSTRKLVLIDSYIRRKPRALPSSNDIFSTFANDLRAQFGLQEVETGEPEATPEGIAKVIFGHQSEYEIGGAAYEFVERMYITYKANLHALANYKRETSSVPSALLLKTIDNDTLDVWRSLVSGRLDTINLDGDHYSLLEERSASSIAENIVRYLGNSTDKRTRQTTTLD